MSARALVLVRTAWGIVLVAAPRRLARIAGGRKGWSTRTDVGRLLGARHLVQAAVTATRPNVMVLALGAAVDALHAASGVALGTRVPRWRRPAYLDAVLAATFAAAGVAAAAAARGAARR